MSADYPVIPSVEGQSYTDSAASKLQSAKNTVVDGSLTMRIGASNAYNAAASHPLTQSIANGPVAENVKDQAVKTQSEFSNLASSRTTPPVPAATGQQLTHYHSFFSSLLSWDNPRASAIAYLSVVTFIFGARYLDLLRYAFKITWMTLGVTVLAEVTGQTLFNTGFTSQIRPRKYFVLSKETLESMTGDVHELINFFVIESQRILFAENVFASAAAFVSAFISYYLVKLVPLWGLALISTSVLFLTPLIYKSNKQLIDEQIANLSQIVNQQTTQVKNIASQNLAAATETTKQYASEYSAKAHDLIGSRGRSVSPTLSQKPKPVIEKTNIKTEDFPAAPKDEFVAKQTTQAPDVETAKDILKDENEPLIG